MCLVRSAGRLWTAVSRQTTPGNPGANQRHGPAHSMRRPACVGACEARPHHEPCLPPILTAFATTSAACVMTSYHCYAADISADDRRSHLSLGTEGG